MDATALILKRSEIQRRMEARRLDTLSPTGYSATSRILPWALSTGIGLVTGMRATRKYGWLSSAAAAVVVPALMKLTRRKTEPEGIFQRILKLVIPSHRD